jgi:hypothetical protein
VNEPQVVATATVIADLPKSEQRTLRLFGVDQCPRVRSRADEVSATPA